MRGVEHDHVVAPLRGTQVRAPVVDHQRHPRVVQHVAVEIGESACAVSHRGLEIDDGDPLHVLVRGDRARGQSTAEADDGHVARRRVKKQAEVAEEHEALIVNQPRRHLVDAVDEDLPLAIDLVPGDGDGRAASFLVDDEGLMGRADLPGEDPSRQLGGEEQPGDDEGDESARREARAAPIPEGDGRDRGGEREKPGGPLDRREGDQDERCHERSEERARRVRCQYFGRRPASALSRMARDQGRQERACHGRGRDDGGEGEDPLKRDPPLMASAERQRALDAEEVEAVFEIEASYQGEAEDRRHAEGAEEREQDALAHSDPIGQRPKHARAGGEPHQHRREHRAERVDVVTEDEEEEPRPHRLEAQHHEAAHEGEHQNGTAALGARACVRVPRRRWRALGIHERERERHGADAEVDEGRELVRGPNAPSAQQEVARDGGAERSAGGVERVDGARRASHAVPCIAQPHFRCPHQGGERRAEREGGDEDNRRRDAEANDERAPARTERREDGE